VLESRSRTRVYHGGLNVAITVYKSISIEAEAESISVPEPADSEPHQNNVAAFH
jgi:hypothetical protein